MQAATQRRLEEINANNASLRNHLERRIGGLELELARLQNMQQESALQVAFAQGELERSEKLHLVNVEMRRHLAEKLAR